jgi:tetratricopeptide (TPR) repeat protein
VYESINSEGETNFLHIIDQAEAGNISKETFVKGILAQEFIAAKRVGHLAKALKFDSHEVSSSHEYKYFIECPDDFEKFLIYVKSAPRGSNVFQHYYTLYDQISQSNAEFSGIKTNNVIDDARATSETDQIARSYYKEGTDELEKGDFSGALTNYSSAIGVNSNFPEAYFGRAFVEQANGDLESALADYSEAIALKPDFAEAYCDRGSARQAKGDLNGALADYSNAIELNPDAAQSYFYRASLEQSKDQRAAIADYSKAIGIKPDYAEAYFYRGGIKGSKDDLDGALADYDKAIELKPDDAEFYFYRASMEEAKTDNAPALVDYSKAIQFKPDYAEAYFARAGIKKNRGDLNGALADYDKAIELKPTWGLAYGYRAEAESIARDPDQAESDSMEAVKLDASLAKNAATSLRLLGWFRCERQQYTNALTDFRQTCSFNPSDDYGNFGLWLCSSILGNPKAATEELRAYLANRQAGNFDDWPSKVGSFLTGKITEQELLAAAKSGDRKRGQEQRCEAYFYIGSRHLIAGDKTGAADFFEKCVATSIQDFSEYQCAKAELRVLEKVN